MSDFLAIANGDSGALTVLDGQSWSEVSGTPELGSIATGCAFSPDGGSLLAVHGGVTVHVIDTESWGLIPGIPNLPGTVQDISFSPTSDKLAVVHLDGGSGNYLTVFDTSSWTPISAVPVMSVRAESCAFNHDGSLLAIGDYDDGLTVVDAISWEFLPGMPLIQGSAPRSCAFSPDGQTLALGHPYGDFLTIVDVATWSVINGMPVPSWDAQSVAWSFNGQYLAVGHISGDRLMVVDTTTWTVVTGTPTLPGTVNSCAFSDDDQFLALAHSGGNQLTVIDVATWSVVAGTPSVSNGAYGVHFSYGEPAPTDPGPAIPLLQSPHAEISVSRVEPALSPIGDPSARIFVDWASSLDPITTRTYYACDIQAPGMDTIRVPISSWQGTQQTRRASYLQAVVPVATEWLDAITERSGGEFIICRGAIQTDGSKSETEMARAPIQESTYNEGPQNATVTLSGYLRLLDDPAGPSVRQLTGIRQRSITAGSLRVRCDIDWFLRPGGQCSAVGTQFRADWINYYVGQNQEYMDVGQRSG